MFSPELFFTPTVWCVPLLSVLYEVLLVCFHNLLIPQPPVPVNKALSNPSKVVMRKSVITDSISSNNRVHGAAHAGPGARATTPNSLALPIVVPQACMCMP